MDDMDQTLPNYFEYHGVEYDELSIMNWVSQKCLTLLNQLFYSGIKHTTKVNDYSIYDK